MASVCGLRGHYHVRLTKRIPVAAGMAGGSTDAAAACRALRTLSGAQVTDEQLQAMLLPLGADIPYCVTGGTQLSEGIGEVLTPLPEPPACALVIVKPPVAVSTAEAYARIVPRMPAVNCLDVVRKPVDQWRHLLTNDFEASIFPLLPEISRIKQQLYDQGALYAAMSGSGSSVFGIFSQAPTLSFDGCYTAVVELQ